MTPPIVKKESAIDKIVSKVMIDDADLSEKFEFEGEDEDETEQ
jgi:hypothetical protein